VRLNAEGHLFLAEGDYGRDSDGTWMVRPPRSGAGMLMRLTDLNPRWCGYGGEFIHDKDGNPVPFQHGIGVIFDCPCGCDQPCFVPFENPLDGSHPIYPENARWRRTGDTFESLTTEPSILRSKDKGGCGWHGFITNGEIITC
jgi:hypothetical protein